MKKYIALFSVVILVLSVFAFAGCSSDKSEENDKNAETSLQSAADTDYPVATITVKDYGVMKVELYNDKAPNTVLNFISLANKGFYNGLTFHRVYKGFMIQGGCPEGNGTGDPGYSIKGEFSGNGFENDLTHTRGVISMARSQHPDSAGSQFFIMHKTSPHLDGSYAAFGKIIEGMDVVNKIAETRTDYSDRPVEDQRMKTVTVDTFGVEYPEPEKM